MEPAGISSAKSGPFRNYDDGTPPLGSLKTRKLLADFLQYLGDIRFLTGNDDLGQVLVMRKGGQVWKVRSAVVAKQQLIVLILAMVAIVQEGQLILDHDYCFIDL